MGRYTVSTPLLPSALPPEGEARRYVANDFLNLIPLPFQGLYLIVYDGTACIISHHAKSLALTGRGFFDE